MVVQKEKLQSPLFMDDEREHKDSSGKRREKKAIKGHGGRIRGSGGRIKGSGGPIGQSRRPRERSFVGPLGIRRGGVLNKQSEKEKLRQEQYRDKLYDDFNRKQEQECI